VYKMKSFNKLLLWALCLFIGGFLGYGLMNFVERIW
jgi:hypothetical protein